MTKIVCLNGIHTSGKTTVGRELRKMGYPFFEEIGTELIQKGYAPGISEGRLPDDAFQRMVMDAEIRRDGEITGNAIVETYHPGDIAHCHLLAGRNTTEEYERYFALALKSIELQAVYLAIPLQAVASRSRIFAEITPELLDFFRRLEEKIFETYERYGIRYTVVPSDRPILEVVTDVKAVVDEMWQSETGNGARMQ